MFAQDAPSGLEVVLVESPGRPTAAALRRAWLRRRAGLACPVLLVAFYRESGGVGCRFVGRWGSGRWRIMVWMCRRWSVWRRWCWPSQVIMRLLGFCWRPLGELDSPVPGLRNVGLLATHELMVGVREMPEWSGAVGRSSGLLGQRGRRLVEGLGFSVQVLGVNTSILTVGGRNQAVAEAGRYSPL